MNQRSTLQGLDLVDRLGLLARLEAMHGVQEEPVGTLREVLERCGREAARSKLLGRHGVRGRPGEVAVHRQRQAVGLGPARQPAPRAEAERAPEVGVRGEQVACRAHTLLLAAPEQPLE